MNNANQPARRGSWATNTPQQPTVAIVQSTTVPSGLSVGAGTGAAPNFVGVAFGVGAPTFRAPNGTLYARFDGTAGGTTLLYVNTSGASTIGTTWTALVTP
jgi:hypothetical protein